MEVEFERKSLSEVVFSKLSGEIINGTLKKGDKLLSESQLCELYNVSRVSVRSAIQKLQAQGLVYTQAGKGTYVLFDNIASTMMRNMVRTLDMSEQEYMDIIELRQTIEYKSIELMVKRGTREDFDNLEKALESMKQSQQNYIKYAEADLQFHFTIIKGSNNRLFYDIINGCRETLVRYFTEMSKVNFDGFKDSIQKHQDILTALKKGDIALAQNTMLGVIETNLKNNMGHLRK